MKRGNEAAKSGSRLSRPAHSRVMSEVVVSALWRLAQRGELNCESLVEDALHFVVANYEEPVAR